MGRTVYVKFKDRADNSSQTVSATIVLDQAVPTGSVAINNGADYITNRNVTLALAANDSGTGARYMHLSDGVTSSGWISYTTSAAWALSSGDGSKTVTVRWRDLAGNISTPATDTIVLDTLPPSVTISPLSSYQASPTFPVSVSGTDATSGVASYDVQFRDGLGGAWTGWLTATTSTTTSFSGQEGHTYSHMPADCRVEAAGPERRVEHVTRVDLDLKLLAGVDGRAGRKLHAGDLPATRPRQCKRVPVGCTNLQQPAAARQPALQLGDPRLIARCAAGVALQWHRVHLVIILGQLAL
jgi:hypothetical protein